MVTVCRYCAYVVKSWWKIKGKSGKNNTVNISLCIYSILKPQPGRSPNAKNWLHNLSITCSINNGVPKQHQRECGQPHFSWARAIMFPLLNISTLSSGSLCSFLDSREYWGLCDYFLRRKFRKSLEFKFQYTETKFSFSTAKRSQFRMYALKSAAWKQITPFCYQVE